MDQLAVISVIFYFLSAFLASRQLIKSQASLNYSVATSSIIALLFHAAWVYQNIILINGQNLPILNVVSLVCFALAGLSLIVSTKLHTGVLNPVVCGMNIITFIAVEFLPGDYITHLEHNSDLAIHVTLAIFSYAILIIANLFALQLAYVDYRLKKHKSPLQALQLPPLMTLERSLFQFISIGFGLLTCALITGFIYLDDMFGAENAHKSVLSILAWIVYAVLLWGRSKHGWRGRLVVNITLVGSILLTFAYFGSRVVRELIL